LTDARVLGQFAERLSGSADIFRRHGRKPWASVNLVTAHDGYTLRDLVSYEQRHNRANGEENRDGHAHNLSWNCGAEGETADLFVLTRRARQQRNFLMTLYLSLGTPLLQGGDELGRTQLGNNNAYCQDNALSWVDWESADDSLLAWVKALARLRRERPELRRDTFLKGAGRAGRDKDVAWLHPDGREMRAADWSSGLSTFGLLWSGHGERSDLLWLVNPTATLVTFHMPRRARDGEWAMLLDSAQEPATAGANTDPTDAVYPLRLTQWILRPHQSVLLERTLPNE
jgi:glycogen operon protein